VPDDSVKHLTLDLNSGLNLGVVSSSPLQPRWPPLKKKNKKKHLFLNPTDLLRSCRYSVFRLLIWGWKRRQLSTGAHLHWSKFASKSFKSLVLLGCACQADFYSLPHCSIKEKPGRGATRPCAQLVGAYAELTVGAMAGLGDRWAW